MSYTYGISTSGINKGTRYNIVSKGVEFLRYIEATTTGADVLYFGWGWEELGTTELVAASHDKFCLRFYPSSAGVATIMYTDVDHEGDIAANAVWTTLDSLALVKNAYYRYPTVGYATNCVMAPGIAISSSGGIAGIYRIWLDD
jgi:hypothetical protein